MNDFEGDPVSGVVGDRCRKGRSDSFVQFADATLWCPFLSVGRRWKVEGGTKKEGDKEEERGRGNDCFSKAKRQGRARMAMAKNGGPTDRPNLTASNRLPSHRPPDRPELLKRAQAGERISQMRRPTRTRRLPRNRGAMIPTTPTVPSRIDATANIPHLFRPCHESPPF